MCNAGELSTLGLALVGGNAAMAQSMASDATKDAGILNAALGLENQAINADLGVIPALKVKDSTNAGVIAFLCLKSADVVAHLAALQTIPSAPKQSSQKINAA